MNTQSNIQSSTQPINETQEVEEIEHTADWAIRVRGADLSELFANAARGMFRLLADLATIEASPDVSEDIELEAFDLETLLVSWLDELLWYNEEKRLVFTRFEIQTLRTDYLAAQVWGQRIAAPLAHIKAVTFHDLEITETSEGYTVTIVFDV
jgi:SHS2 domain-containing protein